MLTDPYWFYVFCQRDSSSEAGPGRAKGVLGRERWLPGTLAKGLSRDNKPKKLECLKGNNNNNKEERAERRLSWDCCVCQLCPSTMAQGQEPGRRWGSRGVPAESGCCSFSPVAFFPDNALVGAPGAAGAQGSPGRGGAAL